jgi:putative transcriptional regulator
VYSHAGSSAGQLLVACPPLEDPNFDRTVVLMLEHDEEGAIGVVLNRPLPQDTVDGLEEWCAVMSEPGVLFSGGPVERAALIGVVLTEDGGWETVDLSEAPPAVVRGFRLFVGYSGWGAGQLDVELAAGAWMVFPAEAADLVAGDPTDLWRTVLRRQGGRLAWIAAAPDDLSMN